MANLVQRIREWGITWRIDRDDPTQHILDEEHYVIAARRAARDNGLRPAGDPFVKRWYDGLTDQWVVRVYFQVTSD